MAKPPTWVTACIPVYRATVYLRASVTSLLNQTYRHLRVIVVNDGDSNPPWPVLADIDDPRLIRFDLGQNRGPYFATAVALEATSDSLFLLQDADDWSSPHRLASLMQIMRRDRCSYAYSTLAQFRGDGARGFVLDKPLFSRPPVTTPLPELKSRIPHHGLFRRDTLRDLGGYFGGFRFGYDELITNLVLLTGSVSWTPEPLYWRRLRPDSLTRAADTGLASDKRRAMRGEMQALYRSAYCDYQAYAARRISRAQFLHAIRTKVSMRRDSADRGRIRSLAAKLRLGMGLQSRMFQTSR